MSKRLDWQKASKLYRRQNTLDWKYEQQQTETDAAAKWIARALTQRARHSFNSTTSSTEGPPW
jgi:hypothetical protein